MEGAERNTEMPNLFVIGAEKCGTTSLHHYLGLHPEISISSIKGPGYFARSSDDYRLIPVRNRDDYLALFEAGTPVRGEATPGYSAFPELGGVPARIATEVEDPKFLYLVRDPIERIESALRHWAVFGRFGVGERAIDVEEIPETYMVSGSRYMTQIEQYLEYFPSESFLVVDSDRLRDDRIATLSRIFEFLGVDSDFDHPGFSEVWNAAESRQIPPSAWRRLRSSGMADRLVGIAPDRMRSAARRFRRRITEAAGDPIPEIVLSPDLDRRLREELKPEADSLREFTGQSFSTWRI